MISTLVDSWSRFPSSAGPTVVRQWHADVAAEVDLSPVSLDFLLEDDDDDVPPPPPPEEDECEANTSQSRSSSTRSSPDDNYAAAAVAAGALRPFGNAADDHAERQLVALRFPRTTDAIFECLEDEGNSGARHADDGLLNDNDDAESYNGGATSTDRDDDDALDEDDAGDDCVPEFAIREDSSVFLNIEEDDGRSVSASPRLHPFLDLDAQKAQLEWDRMQQRAQYHTHMQRATTLCGSDRAIALRILLHEASRHHSALRREGRAALHPATLREIGARAMLDLDESGAGSVQRNLSCMCIFSGVNAAKEYSDHEAERSRRAAMQHRTLHALRMQAARGDSPYFLRSAAVALQPAQEL